LRLWSTVLHKLRDAETGGLQIACQICLEDHPLANTMALCQKGHRFCAECCWGVVRTGISDGVVPACALERTDKCGAVTQATAEAALSHWLREGGQARARKQEMAGWAIRGSAAAGYTSGKLTSVYRSADLARQGAVQCIAKKCKQFVVPPVPHSRAAQRVVCTREGCGTVFCAACRHPYHFRSTCEEALRIHAKWVTFLSEELGAFLVAAVKVDADRYERILREHTKGKGALDEAAKDALKRFDELRKMELWKESHCRRCPHCDRVVHKMSGCDAMVCGDDAHGGNAQRGCGKHFTWGSSLGSGWPAAKPYSADLRQHGEGAEGDGTAGAARNERRLQLDAREEHLLCAGTPLLCDGCGDALIGPRLSCVQCAGTVDLCIGCVGKAVRSKPLTLRDGSVHPRGHVPAAP